ncbi:PAP2 superfamily protein, partial [Vibrio parahaemolyticus VPTS-2010]
LLYQITAVIEEIASGFVTLL